MNKTIRNIGCSILATVMGCSMINFPLFAEEADDPTTKTETVYAVMDPDGTVNNTIVSNWLHDADGIQNIEETLDLTNVENIKGDEKPKVSGKNYTWNVKGNDVYYQGKTTKKLPVSIQIEYKLDGKKIDAKDLEGKSGKLEMQITFTNNISKQINANGKTVTIHPSYLAGGMMDLDTDVFKNVTCKQGKIVNDGSNEILAFATIPGLSQTLDEAGLETVNKKLDLSDTITIKADVKDYKQSEIMMVATNEINAEDIEGIDSVSDLTGGINELMAASEQINEGTHQLADGTGKLKEGIAPLSTVGPQMDQLSDGATQLYEGSRKLNQGIVDYTDGVAQVDTGAAKLQEGTSQLKAGLAPLESAYPKIDQLMEGADQLDQGTARLQAGLKQYTDGVAKLNEGNKQLYGVDKALSDTKQGRSALVKGSQDVADGLSQMNAQVSQLDEAQIDALIQNVQGAQQGLTKLGGLVAEDQQTLGQMEQTIDSAKQSLGGMEALVKDVNVEAGKMNQIIAGNNQKIDAYNASSHAAAASFESTRNEYIAQIDAAIAALQSNQVNEAYQVPVTTTVTNPDGTTHEEVTYQTKTVTVDFSSQIAALDSQKAALQSAQTPADLEALVSLDPTQLNADFAQMKQGLEGMAKVVTNANAALDSMSADIQSAQAILAQMESMLNSANLPQNVDQLKAAIAQLKGGLNQLDTGASQVSNGVARLDQGLDDLQTQSKAAFDQLNAGSQQLVDQSAALNEGAAQLASGTSQLAGQKDKINELKQGLGALQNGVDQLNSGASQLASGTNALNQNSAVLKDGSAQIVDGTKQLYDQKGKLNELKSGLNDLRSGVDELDAGAKKLAEGSDQFQAQGMGQLKEKLDLTTGEVKTLMDIVEQIQDLNEENSTFTGAPKGADSTVRFIYRTEEVTDEEE